MSDYRELKKLAEAAPEGPWFGPEYAPGTSYVFDVDLGTLLAYESIDSEKDACLRYVAAANPAAVMALIAENEAMAKRIFAIDVVHGPKEELRWSALEAERDQLKAEISGLKTGYEAYEQVVEGLRAELDEAKQFQPIGEACLSNRDTLRASLGLKLGDHLHEHVEGLRKDAERYRWMRERDLETVHRGGVFAGVTPENLVLNGNDLDDRIDAAMDKGIAVQGDVISGRVVGN